MDFTGDHTRGHWFNGRVVKKVDYATDQGFVDMTDQGNSDLPPKPPPQSAFSFRHPKPHSAHAIFDLAVTCIKGGYTGEEAMEAGVTNALVLVGDYLGSGDDSFKGFRRWCQNHQPLQQVFQFTETLCGTKTPPPSPKKGLASLFKPKLGGSTDSFGRVIPPIRQLRRTGGPRPLIKGPTGIDNPFMRELRNAIQGMHVEEEPELVITHEQQLEMDLAKARRQDEDAIIASNRARVRNAAKTTDCKTQ